MRILVTGATGFLGHHLVRQLREADHDVVALCRSEAPALAELGVAVRKGDVLDAGSVADAAAGCEAVMHCAGLVSRDEADAGAMYRVHVDGTKTTLTACREAGVKRAVVASTSGVIAVSEDPDEIRDEDAETPMEAIARWPYYRSKLFAERAALELHASDFEVVVVNPSLLLGPGDLRDSSTEDVRKVIEGKVPVCPAGGVAFVDARDAAAAMILALEKGKGGRRYLINAANMTLEVFFGRIARTAGVDAPPVRLPRASATVAGAAASLIERAAKALDVASPIDRISAEMAQYYWYCDSARAVDELGWNPRDPGETISDTVADLRARGVVWPKSN